MLVVYDHHQIDHTNHRMEKTDNTTKGGNGTKSPNFSEMSSPFVLLIISSLIRDADNDYYTTVVT